MALRTADSSISRPGRRPVRISIERAGKRVPCTVSFSMVTSSCDGTGGSWPNSLVAIMTINKRGMAVCEQDAKVVERETRIELATNSLEGCDATIELLPRPFLFYTRGPLIESRGRPASKVC